MSNIIEVKNLSKIYGAQSEKSRDGSVEVRALDHISLNISKGDYVAIQGPSGSGKSTLMQILGLLDKPSQGSYFLDGVDINKLDDIELATLRAKKIGFIFQFFNLLPRTTATDNVALPMLYNNLLKPIQRAQSLLKQVGLSDRLNHKPHQLSGGQQQRVAIARALANQPELLFADEPTGNISSQQAQEILNLLEELNRQGTTIVLVTHEPSVAARANRLLTVKDGKIADDVRLKPMPEIRTKNNLEITLEKSKSSLIARLKENMRMAMIALSLNKLRTALATLGIIIGIASVVAMLAIGRGAQKAIEEQVSALGTNLLSLRPLNPKSAKNINQTYRKFTLEDYQALLQLSNNQSPIQNVDAQAYGTVSVGYGSANAYTDLIAATANNQAMENNTPIAGRFFTEEENQNRSRVALIGQTVVKNLFPEGTNPVGSTIKLNRSDFTVIGVLPAKGSTAFKDRDDVILVPLQTGLNRVLGKKYPNSLMVAMRNPKESEQVSAILEQTLRDRRRLPANESSDFEIRNLNEIQELYTKTTQIISSMLAAIAAISLLVGGIGIMNVMLVAVKERTREVGLRKALGAKNKDILVQFLLEATVIGILGGLLGISLGIGLSWIATYIFSWPALVSTTAIMIACLFSIAVGILFGLWPAKHAARLSPIEALRYE